MKTSLHLSKAVCSTTRVLCLGITLWGANNVEVQAAGTMWDSYAGSSSVYIGYAGYSSVLGPTSNFPGSPQLDVQINGIGGGGHTLSLSGAIMDTGSTGIVTSLEAACNKLFTCHGSTAKNFVPDATAIIGYGTISYTSSGVQYDGFYINAEVKVQNGGSGPTMSTSQVPIFVATNKHDSTQAKDPAPKTVQMFGIGFGRGNANGIQLTDANGNLNGVTLYGKSLNPFLNLTQLDLGSGLTSNISSIAPGYVVTSQGIYLGLSQSVVGGQGPFVALAPGQSAPASNVSSYAAAATATDWRVPPMMMQIANNAQPGGTTINGYYYGTMLVDTGINNAILATRAEGGINSALLNSTTPTYITIGLPGITGNQAGQYTYVFQGVCDRNSPKHVGCGPAPMTTYNGGQAALMVPVYPISSMGSANRGVDGQNTGFANAVGAPFLNTGVSFLNYFNVVYDPVSGFIGYQPNGSAAGVDPSLLSVSPMLALQGSIAIPDGTDVGVPLFLFTAIGNQTRPPRYAPVDVVLSSGGTVTVSQPITSDFIAGCTLANCSTGVVIKQGTFVFNAANSYLGATTIKPGATLALGPNGSIANSFGVTANGLFDISGTSAGTSIVSLSGAGLVNLGSRTLTVTKGSGIFSGTITDGGLGGGLTIAGGAQTLSGVNAYTGPTTINSGGALLVNSSLTDSPIILNPGGTIGGSGTVGDIVVNGGIFSPGNWIGNLTVRTNHLVMTSAVSYLLDVSPTTADRITVAGAATLGGTVYAAFQPGIYLGRNYTVFSAAGGRTGTFDALTTINLPRGLSADLSYTSTDAVLNLTAVLGRNAGLTQNQQGVADAVDAFFNKGGTLPAGVYGLFNLSGSNLGGALSRVSGEAATGVQQAGFQMSNQFLSLMLDPFVDGRSGGAAPNAAPLGFAPERETLPEDVARAYAAVAKAPAAKAPALEPRWGVWGSSYGGSNQTGGDRVVGGHDLSARAFGFAGGFDYHLTPDAMAGFSLAGGGTSWSLAQGLGGGRSDVFQFGAYGTTRSGPAYLAGALAYAHHWMSTDRLALAGDRLTAEFGAQSFSGRVESGYRFDTAFGTLTPYAALQAQSFHTPRYSELDAGGSGSALTYDARTATATRSELGGRFDRLMALDASTALVLRGRLAWAHDWVSDPTLIPTFQSLPGVSFVVDGALPAKDSVLASAGAELRLANGVSLLGRFNGEFAADSSTYTGMGTVRYAW
ncbi:autotransporter outer membrane beta-barrel domain-containing protein [Bradyrhizobium cenepequi]